jgi:hypothetical protein
MTRPALKLLPASKNTVAQSCSDRKTAESLPFGFQDRTRYAPIALGQSLLTVRAWRLATRPVQQQRDRSAHWLPMQRRRGT